MEVLPIIDLIVPIELPGYIPDLGGFETPIGMSLSHVLAVTGLPVQIGMVELSLTITDDAGIRITNLKHRDLDEPTDVLSFPFFESGAITGETETDGPPVLLGDIVLSIETIKRQADEREISFMERFSECLVHGILHLLGHVHDSEDECEKMETLEDRLVPEVIDIFNNQDKYDKYENQR